MTRNTIAILLLIGLIAGCDATHGPNGLALCADSVDITVGPGTSPSISWTPNCRASEVIVDPNSDFVDYWVIRTVGDTNGLHPPLQYGTAPNGASNIVGPFVLQAGTTYRARVVRATGDTTAPFAVIGATFFQP